MSTPEHYDAIVIGTGEAGKFITWHLGSQSRRVAAIEKDEIGGACPNVACLPTKNVVHSAKVASFFQRGAEFGIVHDLSEALVVLFSAVPPPEAKPTHPPN